MITKVVLRVIGNPMKDCNWCPWHRCHVLRRVSCQTLWLNFSRSAWRYVRGIVETQLVCCLKSFIVWRISLMYTSHMLSMRPLSTCRPMLFWKKVAEGGRPIGTRVHSYISWNVMNPVYWRQGSSKGILINPEVKSAMAKIVGCWLPIHSITPFMSGIYFPAPVWDNFVKIAKVNAPPVCWFDELVTMP